MRVRVQELTTPLAVPQPAEASGKGGGPPKSSGLRAAAVVRACPRGRAARGLAGDAYAAVAGAALAALVVKKFVAARVAEGAVTNAAREARFAARACATAGKGQITIILTKMFLISNMNTQTVTLFMTFFMNTAVDDAHYLPFALASQNCSVISLDKHRQISRSFRSCPVFCDKKSQYEAISTPCTYDVLVR
jgi:hypothetical protein